MPVYTFDPLHDPRWPVLLERHPRASTFHSRGWLEALRRTYGYEPVGYTTSPPGTALANGLVFCRVASRLTGRRLVSLPFSDHAEPLVDTEEDLHHLLGLLRRQTRREGAGYLEIRPVHGPRRTPEEFREGEQFYLHRIDLRPSLDALFRSFHRSCTQRKIRRAEREALRHEAGRSERLLHEFYDLLVLTCRRKRLPPQPLDWFRHLAESMGEALTIHVASKNGRPAAGIVTLRFKRTLVYKYGGSDPGFNALGAMHLLLWTAIQDAKRSGLQEIDLGRSDLDMPGLVAFKDRWGSTRSRISYLRSTPEGRGVLTPSRVGLAKQLFGRLPDPLLVAAGRLLYRHIG
jgi:hypothetical protein